MCLGIPGQVIELSRSTSTSLASTSAASVASSTSVCSRTRTSSPATGCSSTSGSRCRRSTKTKRGMRFEGAPAHGPGAHRRAAEHCRHRESPSDTRSDASSTSTATRRPRGRWSRGSPSSAGDDHFKFMEVCGGHTHTIYRHGIEHVLPDERRAGARPGLPGVRDPDGPGRRRHRGRGDARRDLHVVRRHDARARRQREPARGEGAGRRRALRLLAARRAAHRGREPGPRGGVLRRRVRDDRALDRAHAAPGARARRRRTSACSATTSRSSRRSRRSSSRPTCGSTGSSGPGTCRPSSATARTGSCPTQYGKPLVTAGFEPLDILQAIDMLLAQIREGRCEVENQYTRVVRDEGNPRALAGAGRGVRAPSALRVARPRLHLAERAEAARRVRRLRRRAAVLECRACGSPTRRRASAARC